jgi:hypothetical protein
LLYLALLPALIAVWGSSGLLLTPIVLYAFLTIATAAWIGWSLRDKGNVPLAALLILTVHLCYGAGVLRGLLGRNHSGHAATVDWDLPRAQAGERAELVGRSHP